VWCVVCGVWCVVCGVWCVVCGVWCVVCGVYVVVQWCVVCVCGDVCGCVCGQRGCRCGSGRAPRRWPQPPGPCALLKGASRCTAACSKALPPAPAAPARSPVIHSRQSCESSTMPSWRATYWRTRSSVRCTSGAGPAASSSRSPGCAPDAASSCCTCARGSRGVSYPRRLRRSGAAAAAAPSRAPRARPLEPQQRPSCFPAAPPLRPQQPSPATPHRARSQHCPSIAPAAPAQPRPAQPHPSSPAPQHPPQRPSIGIIIISSSSPAHLLAAQPLLERLGRLQLAARQHTRVRQPAGARSNRLVRHVACGARRGAGRGRVGAWVCRVGRGRRGAGGRPGGWAGRARQAALVEQAGSRARPGRQQGASPPACAAHPWA
jgi:hypothetical protein